MQCVKLEDADGLRKIGCLVLHFFGCCRSFLYQCWSQSTATECLRLRFAAASEACTGERRHLLFETIETKLEALSAEIEKPDYRPG